MNAAKPLRVLAFLMATLIIASAPNPGQAADPTPPVVTYDRVLEYLRLEVKEDRILSMVHSSPTAFTLGQAQVEELRKAGASQKLIEAMQKKGQAVAPGSDVSDFVVILDCSGSMKDPVEGGTTKWAAAQQAAIDLIMSIPDGRKLAFIAYGHDGNRGCQAVDVVRPLAALDRDGRDSLKKGIQALKPVGATPIALSLRKAGEELARGDGLAKVVLITDGMETCKGDPAEEAGKLLAKYPGLRGGVDVVGFAVKPDEGKALAQIAESGKGKYYDARTAKDLVESVKVIERQVARPEPPKQEPAAGLSPAEQALVEQLADKDYKVRRDAAEALGKRKAVAAVPFLMRRVADDGWWEYAGFDQSKIAAADALKALAPDREEEALIAATKSKNADVRAWAANRLGEGGKK